MFTTEFLKEWFNTWRLKGATLTDNVMHNDDNSSD